VKFRRFEFVLAYIIEILFVFNFLVISFEFGVYLLAEIIAYS
jgi:hypothetical protein